MKTDRELLELAAKANWQADLANEEVSLRYSESDEGILYLHADNQDHNGRDREFVWNPLADDGDALRLAVKLGIKSRYNSALGQGLAWDFMQREFQANVEECGRDECAATRRAIVRAAAELTKET